jgi:hypothetical protein
MQNRRTQGSEFALGFSKQRVFRFGDEETAFA